MEEKTGAACSTTISRPTSSSHLVLQEISKDRQGRDQYIRRGPIRDKLDQYPKTKMGSKMRNLKKKWFENRTWLVYFKIHYAAFCFACRVFGSFAYDLTF